MTIQLIQQRKYEKIIGLLFIIATLAYGIGSTGLSQGLTNGTSGLTQLFPFALLEVINSIAVSLIGFYFYLFLRNLNEPLLKGYLFTRLAEGLLLILGTVLSLTPSTHNPLSPLFFHDVFFNLAMLVLGIYSTYFFFNLLTYSLGPRWLMCLGIIGYSCLTLYSILALVPSIDASMFFFIPGGLFEVILPIYLLFTGLKKTPKEVLL